MTDGWDVVVVGGGNAGFSAAQAARQAGSTVLLLEKSKAELAGGNTYYTAGAFRLAHGGVEELAPLLTASDRARVDNGEVVLGAYGAELFTADLDRVTRGRSAPELAEVLVHESQPAIQWLAELGVEFTLLYERQSYEVDGARRFWGGLSVGAVDEGPGLMRRHTESARAAGIEVRYEAPVLGLIGTGDGRTTGVVYENLDGHHAVRTRSVVICANGFQADPRLRAAYLSAE
jgi:tricarballylate dehydrogenase